MNATIAVPRDGWRVTAGTGTGLLTEHSNADRHLHHLTPAPPTADRGPGRNADDQQARSRRDQPFVSPTSSMIPNEECR
jgi:hypothetical protein